VNYTILDNNGGLSNIATITVNVANNPPVANNDVVGTASNTPVIVPASTNDTDTDGTIDVTSIDLDPATAGKQTTFTVAGKGTFTANADGTVTFVPLATFTGAASVNYTVQDNNGGLSNIATITVNVANNLPVANNDAGTTASNTTVIVAVAGNDTDTDGTIDITSIDLDPATPGKQTTFTVAGEGTFTANADGTVTFVPLATFSGVTTPVNYTIVDNNGGVSNTGTIAVTVGAAPLADIRGVVVNDANGLTDNTLNGPGTNAGGLNAVLVDAVSGNVVAVTAVQPDGTYGFTSVAAGNYSLLITTASATPGNPAPAAVLPAGWVSTGENLGTGAGSDGTVNGILPLGTVNANISNAYFAIEQPPVADDVTLAGQVNPGGTSTITVPALTGNDPEQGVFAGIGNGDTILINTVPANGTLYYNGVAVTAGTTINNYNPALLTLDPNDGLITVTFTYSEIDGAGAASIVPATVLISFSSAVPVDIISFTATKNGVNALLKWSTAQELNSSYFEIERSADGVSFTTIGKVKAAGNSGIRIDYQFEDLATIAGNNFYRLKETDIDGRVQYSDVRVLRFEESGRFVIYPNPAVNEVKIKFSGDNMINRPAVINVVSADGKLMSQKKISVLNRVEKIDVRRFVTGSYFIHIVSGSTTMIKPFKIIH
jgi:CshA-type fibril repeat protein